jgi:hypothetical protein
MPKPFRPEPIRSQEDAERRARVAAAPEQARCVLHAYFRMDRDDDGCLGVAAELAQRVKARPDQEHDSLVVEVEELLL